MRKKTKKRMEELFLNSIASVIAGLAICVGTFIALMYEAMTSGNYAMGQRTVYARHPMETILVVAVLSVCAGIVGPFVYRIVRDRGRGSLKDVKEQTRAQEARRRQNMR